MPNPDQYQPFVKSVVLAAGDAVKEIEPAPGVGQALYIRRITVTIFTSAAQAVDIESSDGAVELIKAAASLAAGIQLHYGSHHGIKLPDNTALVAQPVAAGVAALVTAEGYILGKFE